MTRKVLQDALSEVPTQWKDSCSVCSRRLYCKRMQKILAALASAQETHEDLEYKIRFRSLLQALLNLGFDYPDGGQRCDLAVLDSREARDLLREAQELLIEVRDAPCLDRLDRA